MGEDVDVPCCAGYSEASPMVYCGLFPTDSDQYEDLREALGKLQINDAALCYEPEQSSAMRFPGFVAHGDCAGATGARV